MSISISNRFQNQVDYIGSTGTTITELLKASNNVTTAQEPIIASRVKSLITSIIKDDQLWDMIVVATYDGKDYLVSGRHRTAAIATIFTDYCVNAANKVVRIPGEGLPEGAVNFNFNVDVLVVECHTMKAIARLQESFNGSRSMTAAERLLTKASYTKLTPSEAVKQSLSRKLAAAINCTFQTGLAMAGAFSAKVKTFVYTTDEQLDELVERLVGYVEEDAARMPSELARDYKKLVDAVCYEEVDSYDDEGTATRVPYISYWAQDVSKPAKAAKVSALSNTSAKLQKALAQLAANGMTPEQMQALGLAE